VRQSPSRILHHVLLRRQPTANLIAGVRTLYRISALAVRAQISALEASKDVTKDDTDVVSAVHRALAGKVGEERFAVWFGRGVRMEPCGKTLRIAAADTFRLDYLRRAFRADLLEAAKIASALFDVKFEDVEFVVDATAASHNQPVTNEAPSNDAASAEAASPPTLISATQQAIPANTSPSAGQASSSRPPRSSFPPPAGRPPLAKRQFASLNDFLASEANRIALAAAQSAATRPGAYSPLTLVGPPGSGKTHLLEGIWRHVRTNSCVRSVVYLTAEQFTNQFIDAIRQQGSGTPSFRRKVREVEMLLIDDLQFFAGKPSTITELRHTIDALMANGRQLVFAADRPLAELRGLGPEIPARLAGGLVCTLEAADYSLRLSLLRQMAQRQGMKVSDDVLTFVAGQFQGDARHLAGALNRLRAASEAHDEVITLAFARDALADLVYAARRPVRLPEIVEAVCDVMGVEAKDLQSGNKSASSTVPRMLIMFLARKYTRAALSEISQSLGRKSHSTVVSAQQKVTQWLTTGKKVSLGQTECAVEDAIKRIEGRLRIG
jgi:chromosomal replication initiator protein